MGYIPTAFKKYILVFFLALFVTHWYFIRSGFSCRFFFFRFWPRSIIWCPYFLFFAETTWFFRGFHQINLKCMFLFFPLHTLAWRNSRDLLVRTENTSPNHQKTAPRWRGERLHCRVLRDGRSLWANWPQVKDSNKMGGRYSLYQQLRMLLEIDISVIDHSYQKHVYIWKYICKKTSTPKNPGVFRRQSLSRFFFGWLSRDEPGCLKWWDKVPTSCYSFWGGQYTLKD